MFMFGWDPTFILLLPAMFFAMWAQWKVQRTYAEMSRVRAASCVASLLLGNLRPSAK